MKIEDLKAKLFASLQNPQKKTFRKTVKVEDGLSLGKLYDKVYESLTTLEGDLHYKTSDELYLLSKDFPTNIEEFWIEKSDDYTYVVCIRFREQTVPVINSEVEFETKLSEALTKLPIEPPVAEKETRLAKVLSKCSLVSYFEHTPKGVFVRSKKIPTAAAPAFIGMVPQSAEEVEKIAEDYLMLHSTEGLKDYLLLKDAEKATIETFKKSGQEA